MAFGRDGTPGGRSSGSRRRLEVRSCRWQPILLALLLAGTVAGCAGKNGQHRTRSPAIPDTVWDRYNDSGTRAFAEGRYEEAREMFIAAVREAERRGDSDARLATSLSNLAAVHRARGAYADAEPLDRRALEIQERTLGLEHPYVANTLLKLADTRRALGYFEDADQLARRALSIRRKLFGPDHTDVAAALTTMGLIYSNQGRYEEAEPLFQRALEIYQRKLGPHDVTVAWVLESYAALLRKSPRAAEAAPLEIRARMIRNANR
jgi:tetratricopeptide (TPR) repeat protein